MKEKNINVPRFRSAYINRPSPDVVVIGDYDPAIPDLSFTVRELQEKFTLQTQVAIEMMRGGKQPRYEFKDANSMSEADLDAAFNSPAIQNLRGYDLVDIASIADGVSRIPARLEAIKDLRKKIKESQRVQTDPPKPATPPAE